MSKIEIYDTTLRDGAQAEDISLSLDDKCAIIVKLDQLGLDYIEAGWPGANPERRSPLWQDQVARNHSFEDHGLWQYLQTRQTPGKRQDDKAPH